jgi:signal transduction histidine kinase
MKLNNKILLSNSVLSLFMLIVTGFGMFYVVSTTIYDELDYHLMQHKIDIQNLLVREPESLIELQNAGAWGSNEWVEVEEYDGEVPLGSNNFSTVDTLRYSAGSQIMDSYRLLETTVTVNGKPYVLKVYEEVAAWDKISMKVLISVLAALFIWVMLLYVVNQYVFGRILAPFYDTIDRLEQISSPTEMGEPLAETDTYEIRVLNKAINSMLSQIKSSFEDQKAFIQNASHELLTPLSIIRQKTEKMLTNSDGLNRSTIERLNEIQQTTVRLTRLSNALLLISRVENKLFEMNDEVYIAEIIAQVLNELHDFVELKKLKIEKNLSQKIKLTGNRELIHSAIYNIIQNAIKFSPEGGKILVSVQQENAARPLFLVRDEGPGIPQEMIEKVFDRFKKREWPQNKSNESPGLGLSIVKSICELHGFEYQAENNPDKGITVTLRF